MNTTRITDNKIINTELISPKSFFNTNFNLNPLRHYSIIKEYQDENIPQFLGYFMKELNISIIEYPKVILNIVSNNWNSSKLKFQTESRYIFQLYGEQEIYLTNFLNSVNNQGKINKIEKINLEEGDLIFIPCGFILYYKGISNSKKRDCNLFFEFVSPKKKVLDFLTSSIYPKDLVHYN
tara:strand:- start:106 stop:645 length:540 start_codon:yes stop_codon:yes gene_type:complete